MFRRKTKPEQPQSTPSMRIAPVPRDVLTGEIIPPPKKMIQLSEEEWGQRNLAGLIDKYRNTTWRGMQTYFYDPIRKVKEADIKTFLVTAARGIGESSTRQYIGECEFQAIRRLILDHQDLSSRRLFNYIIDTKIVCTNSTMPELNREIVITRDTMQKFMVRAADGVFNGAPMPEDSDVVTGYPANMVNRIVRKEE